MRRRAQGFTLIEIMVVIAIIAGLVATVAVVVPNIQEKNKRMQCQQRLGDITKVVIDDMNYKQGRPRYEGVSLWLELRKKFKIRRQEEKNLICPGDQAILPVDTPEAQKAYDDVVLATPPSNMCSYAGRNFTEYPLKNNSQSAQVIGCDRNGDDGKTEHHRDGLNISFDNGSCVFYDRDMLGLTTEEDMLVGPDSSQELLKTVIYVPKRKD